MKGHTMSSKGRTAPVSNLDGLIVFALGSGSFVGACVLGGILGLSVGWLAIVAVTVFAIVTGVAMRITNRRAWHRRAMRHARALNATRAAAAGS